MLGSTTKPSFGRCNIKQNKKFGQLVEELKEWKGKNENSVYPSAHAFAELPSTSEDWLKYRANSFWHAYTKACEIVKKELGEGESDEEEVEAKAAVKSKKNTTNEATPGLELDTRSMSIQYEAQLRSSAQDGCSLQELMLSSSGTTATKTEKKLCFLWYLPGGSSIYTYSLNPDARSMKVQLKVHKLSFNPRAIVLGLNDDIDMTSKQGIMREVALQNAVEELDKKNIFQNSRDERVVEVTINLIKEVDKKQKIIFSQCTYKTDESNKYQLPFCYFEFYIKDDKATVDIEPVHVSQMKITNEQRGYTRNYPYAAHSFASSVASSSNDTASKQTYDSNRRGHFDEEEGNSVHSDEMSQFSNKSGGTHHLPHQGLVLGVPKNTTTSSEHPSIQHEIEKLRDELDKKNKELAALSQQNIDDDTSPSTDRNFSDSGSNKSPSNDAGSKRKLHHMMQRRSQDKDEAQAK